MIINTDTVEYTKTNNNIEYSNTIECINDEILIWIKDRCNTFNDEFNINDNINDIEEFYQHYLHFHEWNLNMIEYIVLHALLTKDYKRKITAISILMRYIDYIKVEESEDKSKCKVIYRYIKKIKEFKTCKYNDEELNELLFNSNFLEILRSKCFYGDLKYYMNKFNRLMNKNTRIFTSPLYRSRSTNIFKNL